MKKLLSFIVALVILCTPLSVRAEDNILNYDTDEIIEKLPENARKTLSDLGADSTDVSELNNLSFEKILNEFFKTASEKSEAPLRTLAILIAIMLLCSILYTFKNSAKTSAMQAVLSVCSTLCITLSLSLPVLSVIENSVNVINAASNFMLAYIPAIFFIVSASGRALSGTSYYSACVFMGQCVLSATSNIIAPFLKLFLGLSITSAVSSNINLNGIIKFISKLIRWTLGFAVTLFSAFLTVKQIIATGLDSVSDRAVKFSLTSFVPVAGAALSEAYKSVESSVGLLKSGVGVLALIAIAVMFLPVLLECVLWFFSIWAAKSAGEMLNLSEPCLLLDSMSTVISTIFAVSLSVMAVFIISTALVFMIGGA